MRLCAVVMDNLHNRESWQRGEGCGGINEAIPVLHSWFCSSGDGIGFQTTKHRKKNFRAYLLRRRVAKLNCAIFSPGTVRV